LTISQESSEAVRWRRAYSTMVKRKRANDDLHNTTEKAKYWATRTSLNPV